MILENAVRRMRAAGILLEHALVKGVSNNAKSSYYRAASILVCTVVEGFTYELVRKLTSKTGHIIDQKSEHMEKHKMPKGIFNSKNDYYICEKTKKDILISDDGVTFGKLIMYLKNKKLLTKSEYRLLNWVRKERNKVHLQGLTLNDIGYTKAKIDKTGKAIQFLVTKLKSHP